MTSQAPIQSSGSYLVHLMRYLSACRYILKLSISLTSYCSSPLTITREGGRITWSSTAFSGASSSSNIWNNRCTFIVSGSCSQYLYITILQRIRKGPSRLLSSFLDGDCVQIFWASSYTIFPVWKSSTDSREPSATSLCCFVLEEFRFWWHGRYCLAVELPLFHADLHLAWQKLGLCWKKGRKRSSLRMMTCSLFWMQHCFLPTWLKLVSLLSYPTGNWKTCINTGLPLPWSSRFICRSRGRMLLKGVIPSVVTYQLSLSSLIQTGNSYPR